AERGCAGDHADCTAHADEPPDRDPLGIDGTDTAADRRARRVVCELRRSGRFSARSGRRAANLPRTGAASADQAFDAELLRGAAREVEVGRTIAKAAFLPSSL